MLNVTRAADLHDAWPNHCRASLLRTIGQISVAFRALAGSAAADSPDLDPRQVHACRRLLKEARALSRLLSVAAGGSVSSVTRSLKTMRKDLGNTRNLDVLSTTTDHLGEELGPEIKFALQSHLVTRRRARLIEKRGPRYPKFDNDLLIMSKAVQRWDLSDSTAMDLAEAARSTYQMARSRGRHAFKERHPVALHDLRTAVIDHRYQIHALSPAWPKLFLPWCTEVQHLRNRLGEHHDLAMLADFVHECALPEKLARGCSTLIETRQARLADRAERAFLRLFSERPGAFRRRCAAYLNDFRLQRDGAPSKVLGHALDRGEPDAPEPIEALANARD